MRLTDPAPDLSVAIALASAYSNLLLPNTALIPTGLLCGGSGHLRAERTHHIVVVMVIWWLFFAGLVWVVVLWWGVGG